MRNKLNGRYHHPYSYHRFSVVNIRAYSISLFMSFLIPVVLAACASPGGTAPDLHGHIVVVGSTALQSLATAASLFASIPYSFS